MSDIFEQLYSFFDFIPIPVFIIDDDMIAYCNEPAKAINPYKMDDLHYNMVLGEILAAEIDTIRATGNTNPRIVTGCFIDSDAYTSTIYTIDEKIVLILFPANYSNKISSINILASIGSILRGPISMLFSSSNLLLPLLEGIDDPKVSKYFSLMEQSYYSLLRIANNITDFSLMESNSIGFYPENTDIVEFCSDLATVVSPLIKEQDIAFTFESSAQSHIVGIDRQKLERLLLNLISNSVKATQQGSKIVLRLIINNQRVLLSVTDNGRGIPPSVMSTVFSRYIQGEMPYAPDSGLGLGLPIVYNIARLHGGTVALESRQGKGTSVTVSLPNQKNSASMLRTPVRNYDYTGGFSHVLVELSDALSGSAFNFKTQG